MFTLLLASFVLSMTVNSGKEEYIRTVTVSDEIQPILDMNLNASVVYNVTFDTSELVLEEGSVNNNDTSAGVTVCKHFDLPIEATTR